MHDLTFHFDEGAEAVLDGRGRDTGPHPDESPARSLWLDGWRCAEDGALSEALPRPSYRTASRPSRRGA